MSLNSSTESFFIWWLAFFDAKPVPRVCPLTVWARITVGAPLWASAALYAAYTLRDSWPPREKWKHSRILSSDRSFAISASCGSLPKKSSRM